MFYNCPTLLLKGVILPAPTCRSFCRLRGWLTMLLRGREGKKRTAALRLSFQQEHLSCSLGHGLTLHWYRLLQLQDGLCITHSQLSTSPSQALCNTSSYASSAYTAAPCSYPIKGNVAPILLSASLTGVENSC